MRLNDCRGTFTVPSHAARIGASLAPINKAVPFLDR
jgi:hypothetical protein